MSDLKRMLDPVPLRWLREISLALTAVEHARGMVGDDAAMYKYLVFCEAKKTLHEITDKYSCELDAIKALTYPSGVHPDWRSFTINVAELEKFIVFG